jgi:hypothetical protein
MGPLWSQKHAEEKATAYINGHPGLIWTREWQTTIPGNMSVIRVQSAGIVDVPIGPIWNQQDAELKARAFIRSHPYLRWTGSWNTTQSGKMSVITIECIVPQQRMLRGIVGSWLPVPITLRLRNQLPERITIIEISGVDDWDWGATDRQPGKFARRNIAPNGEITDGLDVNYFTCSAPFQMKLVCRGGRSVQFRIDSRVTIDAAIWHSWDTQWNYSIAGTGLASYFLVNMDQKLLEINVCEATDLQEEDEFASVSLRILNAVQKGATGSVRPLGMPPDGWEPIFWRTLLKMLLELGSSHVLPDALDAFNRLLERSRIVTDWDQIFRPFAMGEAVTYYSVIQHLPQILSELNLGMHQLYFIQVTFYAMCTIVERIWDLKEGTTAKEQKRYRNHLRIVRIFSTMLELLWARLQHILLVDGAIVLITVALLPEIAAAVEAAIDVVTNIIEAAETAVAKAAEIIIDVKSGTINMEIMMAIIFLILFISAMCRKFLPH